MKKCERISSRILWVKLRFKREERVFVCVYSLVNGAMEEDRRMFWENLNESLSGFEAGVYVYLVGDLSAKIGVDMEGGIIGPFGVDDRNLIGDNLVELYMAIIFIIGNTWYDKNLNQRLTCVSELYSQKSLIDYIRIRKG